MIIKTNYENEEEEDDEEDEKINNYVEEIKRLKEENENLKKNFFSNSLKFYILYFLVTLILISL